MCKHHLGRFFEAIADFDAALALLPNDAEIILSRGVEKAEAGYCYTAIEDFTRILYLNPNYAEAYFNRAMASFNLYKFAEAESDYNMAYSIDSSAEALTGRGLSRLAQHQMDTGCADLKMAIELGYEPAIKYLMNYCKD